MAAAQAAFPAWAATPPLRRARVIFKLKELIERDADKLAQLISQRARQGRVATRAAKCTRGIEVVEFACGIPHLLKGEFSEQVGTGVDSWSMRQPLGVCAGITPFNFPAMVPMWMFPVAIACGNTFVLKPSERDPSPAMLLARAAARKPACRTACSTSCTATRKRSTRCSTHPRRRGGELRRLDADRASTSTRPARAHGKRVQALGGAKNHLVVMPDADLDQAADALIGAAYGSAGERCMAISVAVAVGGVADALVERLAPARTRAEDQRRHRRGCGDPDVADERDAEQEVRDHARSCAVTRDEERPLARPLRQSSSQCPLRALSRLVALRVRERVVSA